MNFYSEIIRSELKKSFSNKTGSILGILFIVVSLLCSYLETFQKNPYEIAAFWQGLNNMVSNPVMVFYFVMLILFIFSPIYSDEIVSGVNQLILTSKNKYRVIWGKVIFTFVTIVGLYLIYIGIQLVGMYFIYGSFDGITVGIDQIFGASPLFKGSYSIGVYVLVKGLIACLILTTLGIIATMFSFVTNSSLASMGCLVALMMIPKFLLVMHVIPAILAYILSYLNFFDLLLKVPNMLGMQIGALNLFGINVDIYNIVIGLTGVMLVVSLLIIKFKSTRLTITK